MFTGLVTALGQLKKRLPLESGERFSFLHSYGPLTVGESIAVSGACLTVTSDEPHGTSGEREFTVELSAETLRLTLLGTLTPGVQVNLERALQVHDRLGGHLVTGHVDGIGMVSSRRDLGAEMTEFSVHMPRELGRYVAKKGSITVQGVSLTVNDVKDSEGETEFAFVVIPHTKSHTTLGSLHPGSQVALEVDLVARYVERLLNKE